MPEVQVVEDQQRDTCMVLQKFCSIRWCYYKTIYPKDGYRFHFKGADFTQENKVNFSSNIVQTIKYPFWVGAIFIQFLRIPNIYFCIIALLFSRNEITSVSPYSAWAPWLIVLSITVLREWYEDYQRSKSDKETNEGKTCVMRGGQRRQVKWSQVIVGDIVYTQKQEIFPADLILISSSGEGGTAFIETASLDGQKNLKIRNGFKQLISFNSDQKISKLSGQFIGPNPNRQLHKLSAQLLIQNLDKKQAIQIDGDRQLLYRGTRLKNTNWIYGLVIYTGCNSKIMSNSASNRAKMSQIQNKVNNILVFIFVFQIFLCIIVGFGYFRFRSQNQKKYNYIDWPTKFSIKFDSFLTFLSQLTLISAMIPISLLVSIEMVKFFQKYFIEKDKLMFSNYRNKGVQVKSASLNQELGQIQYVFTDKTGTLTMNIMQFKIAVIANQLFGDLSLIDRDRNPDQKGTQVNQGKFSYFKDDKLKQMLDIGTGDRQLDYPIIVKDTSGGNQLKLSTLKQVGNQFMKALSLAHQVMPEVDKNGKKIYQGPSPDQITLVDGAKQIGYQFIRSTKSQSVVKINGKNTSFELFESFQFNSDRKRMSVIIKQKGVMKLYMKGADSIVLKYTAKDNRLKLESQLQRFSIIGLRTLLVGMKTVSQSEYNSFKKARQELKKLSSVALREEKQNELISKLEEGVYIIGATAVLDRLQEQVPETIRDLIRAKIKVWMLTGDKMETAQNIARSCHLIQSEFHVLKFKGQKDTNQQQIVKQLKQLVAKSQELTNSETKKGLLIDGNDLTHILISNDASAQLANLAKSCQAVVCCRLLPSQKADVVKLVRNNLKKITLAIGDGANDVPMIKQAHIGIGLFGEQGMGAVNSSDYALPQFRMLWRLLLVHGRWNYIRISQMILYFFYKNMLYALPQFFNAFYSGFSAQTIFDDYYMTLFNFGFTSIPLIIRAVFEQDVNYIVKIDEEKAQDIEQAPTIKTLIKQQKSLPSTYKTNKYLYRLFPKIYFIGQENCIFNKENYFSWMCEAFLESLIIFIVSISIIGQNSVNDTGINSDYWLVSLTIYTSVIFVVTFKLGTHTKFWSIFLLLAITITSIGFYVLHMWLTNFTLTNNIYGTTVVAWSSVKCYLVVLLCVCIVLLVDGLVIFTDYNRGGYASKMREIINDSNMSKKSQYARYSMTWTDNLTTQSQKVQNRQEYQNKIFKNSSNAVFKIQAVKK